MKTYRSSLRAALIATFLGAVFIVPPPAFGHCDTMDGPVIVAAKAALEQKDITPVLKWIKKDAEARGL